ncbi:MAG TPA: MarR family transcriptional regulator [Roseiarcus sp.]|nr:MarR family transcriptional regulator [Roseiarcus sp.]
MTTDNLPSDALKAANALRRSVARVSRRLRRLRADHGVSPSKLIILGRLQLARRKVTAAALAETEGLKPQSLTRILADLEARGFVRREQSGVDRREILIEITNEGQELLGSDARRQNRWLAEAMATALTPAEADILAIAARLLDRVCESGPSEQPPSPEG